MDTELHTLQLASGTDGDVTVKGRTADVDVGPIEVLEHLDGVPWMSYTEARSGRFALYGDIVYAPLGIGISRARSFGGLTLDAALGLDVEQPIIEAGAAYEIAGLGSSTALDVLAGARYWRQEASIHLALTATLDLELGPLPAPAMSTGSTLWSG
jgi:hypothetical protein